MLRDSFDFSFSSCLSPRSPKKYIGGLGETFHPAMRRGMPTSLKKYIGGGSQI
jgi:hypothetical protein